MGRGVNQMRDEYDFSAGIKNPYAKKLKKSRVTINLDTIVIEYFKDLSEETMIPYQTLINMYLNHCATKKIKPDTEWKETA